MKNTFKKTLSAVTAISLTATLFAAVPANAHSNSASLISKVGESVDIDFNYDTDTTIEKNFKFADGITATHVTGTHTVDDANGYLQMGDPGSDSRLTITDANWQTSNLTNDRYFTEFKFKLNSLTPVENLFVAELCDKYDGLDNVSGTPTSPGVKTSIVKSTDGTKYQIKAGGTTITRFNLKAETWYNVKLDINMINRTYDIYVDGVLEAKNVAFTGGDADVNGSKLAYFDYLEANNIEFPNKFNRIFQYRDQNNTVDICFDDIRVYREPTGVITYGGDDFSNYKQDMVYDGNTIYNSFAGLAVDSRAARQWNFTIDADKGYAISGTGMNGTQGTNDGMQIKINPNTTFNEKSLVTEFKITPQTNTVGTFRFLDNLAKQHGLHLKLENNVFTATYGKTGNVDNSNYTVSKEIGRFEVGKTYKIKACIDLNRTFEQTVTSRSNFKRTLTGLCDIYINDEHVLSNVPMRYLNTEDGDTAAAGLGNVLLQMTDGGEAYFDDFRIYSDEKEEVASRLVADLNKTYTNGIIEGDINTLPKKYTLEGRNTYNIDWSFSGKSINKGTGVNLANTTVIAKIYYPGEENYYITREFDYYMPDFSVDTSDVDFEINSVTFEDASSNKVYGPTDGGKLTGATIKRYVDKEADLYAAVYNGARLSDVAYIPNFEDGDISLNLSVDKNSVVKFFIWSNDGKLTPLASPFEVQRKLFILADSIYDETPPASQPSTGVGAALKSFYNTNNLEIVNLAESGSTIKTFVKTGRFAEAISQIGDDDYVLLSFCHNDEKWPANPERSLPLDTDGVAPYDVGSYEYYYEEYIKAIRLKGGIPVIATAIPRWEFDGDTPTSTHGDYYEAQMKVAEYMKVPVLDVYTAAFNDLKTLGAEESKAYYVEPVDTNEDGSTDKTHMNETGANWVAGIIAKLADDLDLPFSVYKKAE